MKSKQPVRLIILYGTLLSSIRGPYRTKAQSGKTTTKNTKPITPIAKTLAIMRLGVD